MRLPTDPAKLKLLSSEYILKHCRTLEKKADAFEKQLQEWKDRLLKNKEYWRKQWLLNKDIVECQVAKFQWYRISGMIDYINYLLGIVGLSKDNRAEVIELFGGE